MTYVADKLLRLSTADLDAKMEKFLEPVIKGRFYVSAPTHGKLSLVTLPHAEVTLGRFLH